jgi:hypothetical protein
MTSTLRPASPAAARAVAPLKKFRRDVVRTCISDDPPADAPMQGATRVLVEWPMSATGGKQTLLSVGRQRPRQRSEDLLAVARWASLAFEETLGNTL